MTTDGMALQALLDAEKVMIAASAFVDTDEKRARYDDCKDRLQSIITTFRREIIEIDPEGDQQ